MDNSKSQRPRIGVTWIGVHPEVDLRYFAAIEAAGGEAVQLPARADSWAAEMATLQGLLVTGGGDIDPTRYGQNNDLELSRGIDLGRDRLEIEALQYARDQELPVLGICRGFQVINVALGGTLLQDIERQAPGSLPHPSDRTKEDIPSRHHSLRVEPGTILASLLGYSGECRVNSRHHQGLTLEQVAPGLRVSALAPDGIVEGLEAEDGRFLVAVQCHPERADEVPAEMAALFAGLVKGARSMLR